MKRFFVTLLTLCGFLFVAGQTVSAETWVEDFKQNNLDSWKEYDEHYGKGIWAPKTIWEVKNGHLDVWIDPPPTPGIYERFPFEFVAFLIKTHKINVKVNILESSQASVGILIGQYGSNRSVLGETLYFFHLPFFGGAIRIPNNFDQLNVANKVDNPPFPLKDVEVSFDNSHFKFLSEGDLLVEFDVPQLQTVDCIGIIAYVERGAGVIGEFVLDDFEITAPTFYDVNPKGKTAVRWGELKRP